MSTAILRAVATAAFRKPLRPASRTAQDFNAEKRFTCRKTQDDAWNSSPLIAASPHFETRPDQSISPDWCRLGVRPHQKWKLGSDLLKCPCSSLPDIARLDDCIELSGMAALFSRAIT